MAIVGARAVVALRWRDPHLATAPSELFQVFTLRDGRVIAIQDYHRKGDALRATMKAALRAA